MRARARGAGGLDSGDPLTACAGASHLVNNNNSNDRGKKKERRTFFEEIVKKACEYADKYHRKDPPQHDPANARIALWTRVGAYAAIGSVVVAAVATYLLLHQIKMTRQSNVDSTQSFVEGNRAFVFLNGSKNSMDETVLLDKATSWPSKIKITPMFINSGRTPAFHVGCVDRPGDTDVNISFGRPAFTKWGDLGPTQDFGCPELTIDASDLQAMWDHRLRKFIYIYVEYSDAFQKTPRRHTEICSEIFVIKDPRIPIDLDPKADKLKVLRFDLASPECNSAN
jgi:hypothetical protein